MARRLAPEVNAGSMADIAFLLLIFFLVSTTIQTDFGIQRRLPPPHDILNPVVAIKEKNILRVLLNENNQLFVEEEPMKLKELRVAAVAFLDNGGGMGKDDCNYCKGNKNLNSSDNPERAVISLRNHRETSYATYVAVQNELVAAYIELRTREALRLYGKTFSQIKADLKNGTYSGSKNKVKEEIEQLQLMYPMKLSEAEPK